MFFGTLVEIPRQNTLSYNGMKAMKDARLTLNISAFTCATCILGGYGFIIFFVPEFYQSLDGRMAVIQAHTLEMQLWFFYVWILYGAVVVVLNNSLMRAVGKPRHYFDVVVTLSCYVCACYNITIGLIEILSSHSIVATGVPLSEATDSQYYQLYSILVQLRHSTEIPSDVWTVLINVWLLARTTAPKVIPIIGIAAAIMGYAMVYLQLYQLTDLFVVIRGIWPLAIMVWAIKATYLGDSSLQSRTV